MPEDSHDGASVATFGAARRASPTTLWLSLALAVRDGALLVAPLWLLVSIVDVWRKRALPRDRVVFMAFVAIFATYIASSAILASGVSVATSYPFLRANGRWLLALFYLAIPVTWTAARQAGLAVGTILAGTLESVGLILDRVGVNLSRFLSLPPASSHNATGGLIALAWLWMFVQLTLNRDALGPGLLTGPRHRIVYIGCFVLLTAGLLLSTSRSFVLATSAVALGLYVATVLGKGRLAVRTAMGWIVVVTAVAFLFPRTSVWARIQLALAGADPNVTERLFFLEKAFELIRSHWNPVFGIGFGRFTILALDTISTNTVHNQLLHVMLELGSLGALLFIILYTALGFWGGRRLAKSVPATVLVGFLTVLSINSFVDASFMAPTYMASFHLVAQAVCFPEADGEQQPN